VSPAKLNGKKVPCVDSWRARVVQDVRAAHGDAFIIRIRRRVQLCEVPVSERAPTLLAYVQRRALTRSPKQAARLHFGTEVPTLEDMQRLAVRFPVFAE
jgi:hypothetical protein